MQNVGAVSLSYQRSPKRWIATWRDPVTHKRRRQRLPARSFDEAADHARVINEAMTKQLEAHHNGVSHVSVGQAVEEFMENGPVLATTRQNYNGQLNTVLVWFGEQGVDLWTDITPQTLSMYARYCERSTRWSVDTLRTRWRIIRALCRYMTHAYGTPDPSAGVKLRLADCPSTATKTLEPQAMLQVINHIAHSAPDLGAIAALQGLAGLRALEAIHLRTQDIYNDGIHITTTPKHTPKTRWSDRRIPLLPVAMNHIMTWISEEGVTTNHEWLFPDLVNRANPANVYSHRMKRALAAAGVPGYRGKWFRASFATHAVRAGIDDRLLRHYMGHSPVDILGKHYAEISADSLMKGVVVPFWAYLVRGGAA